MDFLRAAGAFDPPTAGGSGGGGSSLTAVEPSFGLGAFGKATAAPASAFGGGSSGQADAGGRTNTGRGPGGRAPEAAADSESESDSSSEGTDDIRTQLKKLQSSTSASVQQSLEMNRLQGMLASGAAAGGQSGSSSFAPASGGGGMGLSAGLEGGGGQSYPPAGPSAGAAAAGAIGSIGLGAYGAPSTAASASGSGGGGGGAPRGIASAANPATRGRTGRRGRAQAAPPPSYPPPPTTAEAQAAYERATQKLSAARQKDGMGSKEYSTALFESRIASRDLNRARSADAALGGGGGRASQTGAKRPRSAGATASRTGATAGAGGVSAGADGEGGGSGAAAAPGEIPGGVSDHFADAGGGGGGGARGGQAGRKRARRGRAAGGRTGATAVSGGVSAGAHGGDESIGDSGVPGETGSATSSHVADAADIVQQEATDLLSLASGADVVTTSQQISGARRGTSGLPLEESKAPGSGPTPPALLSRAPSAQSNFGTVAALEPQILPVSVAPTASIAAFDPLPTTYGVSTTSVPTTSQAAAAPAPPGTIRLALRDTFGAAVPTSGGVILSPQATSSFLATPSASSLNAFALPDSKLIGGSSSYTAGGAMGPTVAATVAPPSLATSSSSTGISASYRGTAERFTRARTPSPIGDADATKPSGAAAFASGSGPVALPADGTEDSGPESFASAAPLESGSTSTSGVVNTPVEVDDSTTKGASAKHSITDLNP